MRQKSRLVAGIGINDTLYIVQPTKNGKVVPCPYMSSWNRMLSRCYNKKIHVVRPTFKTVEVCKEWLVFSNYRKWMVSQDWHGNALDKDIIQPGNKLYSPDRCCFVGRGLNNLLTNMPPNPTKEYCIKKTRRILVVAFQQTDKRVQDGLLRHAALLWERV